MEWTRLDLRKASVLRKEVDLAVRLLSRAASAESEEATVELQALIESAQSRIREIEEFYTHNDDDERSILFEKQRLRLRRAVQSVVTGSSCQGKLRVDTSKGDTNNRPMASGASNSADFQTPNAKGYPFFQRDTTVSSEQRKAAVTPRSTLKSATRSATVNKSINKIPRSPGSMTSNNSQPIYAWELANQSAANNVIRERITTDSASFIPSSASGIYMCDSDVGGDSDELIDFQVVLSAEEFQVYVSRRRNAVAEKKHSERFIEGPKKTADKRETLLSSTPYVDPQRIQNELCRPPQPHKWVGDGAGFKPIGSKVQ